LLVDRPTGAALSLTYWQDEASLRGSEEMATAARAQVMQRGAQVAEVERYELVTHERIGAPHANVFVRINDVHGSVERVDDAIDFSRQQVLPALKRERGWQGMQVLVNRQNGRSL